MPHYYIIIYDRGPFIMRRAKTSCRRDHYNIIYTSRPNRVVAATCANRLLPVYYITASIIFKGKQ